MVRFGQRRLQILPDNQRQSYARCKVEVHLRLDNSLAIYYEGQPLSTRAAPAEAPLLRKQNVPQEAANRPKPEVTGTFFHPWKQWVYR